MCLALSQPARTAPKAPFEMNKRTSGMAMIDWVRADLPVFSRNPFQVHERRLRLTPTTPAIDRHEVGTFVKCSGKGINHASRSTNLLRIFALSQEIVTQMQCHTNCKHDAHETLDDAHTGATNETFPKRRRPKAATAHLYVLPTHKTARRISTLTQFRWVLTRQSRRSVSTNAPGEICPRQSLVVLTQ